MIEPTRTESGDWSPFGRAAAASPQEEPAAANLSEPELTAPLAEALSAGRSDQLIAPPRVTTA